jgi:hypothetical protein
LRRAPVQSAVVIDVIDRVNVDTPPIGERETANVVPAL